MNSYGIAVNSKDDVNLEASYRAILKFLKYIPGKANAILNYSLNYIARLEGPEKIQAIEAFEPWTILVKLLKYYDSQYEENIYKLLVLSLMTDNTFIVSLEKLLNVATPEKLPYSFITKILEADQHKDQTYDDFLREILKALINTERLEEWKNLLSTLSPAEGINRHISHYSRSEK